MTHVSKPLQEALRTIKATTDAKRIEALEHICLLYRAGYTIEATYSFLEYEDTYGRIDLDIEETE